MNPEDYSRDDIVTQLSPALAAVLATIALLAWILTVIVRGRFPQVMPIWIGFGFVLAGLTIWLTLQFLSSFLSLATSWPLIALTIGGGIAAELLIGFYQFERTLVSKSRGRWLLGLRLAALAVLLLILAQPVRSFLESREIERDVAILIDESDSMLLSDQRLSSTEALDRAALLGLEEVANRPAFQEVTTRTASLSRQLQAERESLQSGPNAKAGLETRAALLPEFFEGVEQDNQDLVTLLTRIRQLEISGEVKTRVEDYLKRSRDGLSRILEAAKSASESGNAEELIRQLELAEKEIGEISNTLEQTAIKADGDFLSSLKNQLAIVSPKQLAHHASSWHERPSTFPYRQRRAMPNLILRLFPSSSGSRRTTIFATSVSPAMSSKSPWERMRRTAGKARWEVIRQRRRRT